MAKLENTGNTGLPKPPAPPRRGANPWRLSETARKPEPRPQPLDPHLLDELMQQASAEEHHAHEETPPPAAAKRPRSGIPFMAIVIIAALIAYRIISDGRVSGGWINKFWPLLVIAFIAHGWWQARQRREAAKQNSMDAGKSGR